ncbi:hypothetical protein Tco_0228458 [Tanacetum coccineum]
MAFVTLEPCSCEVRSDGGQGWSGVGDGNKSRCRGDLEMLSWDSLFGGGVVMGNNVKVEIDVRIVGDRLLVVGD